MIWVSLEDFGRLETLVILYARFFARTHPKGRDWQAEAMKFIEFGRKMRSEWPEIRPFIPEDTDED